MFCFCLFILAVLSTFFCKKHLHCIFARNAVSLISSWCTCYFTHTCLYTFQKVNGLRVKNILHYCFKMLKMIQDHSLLELNPEILNVILTTHQEHFSILKCYVSFFFQCTHSFLSGVHLYFRQNSPTSCAPLHALMDESLLKQLYTHNTFICFFYHPPHFRHTTLCLLITTYLLKVVQHY